MANTRIFYNNLIKNATITADEEATNHDKTRLYYGSPVVSYRSTTTGEITITFDFGAATTVKAVTLHRHNIVSGDTTYKWEASTDNFSSTAETEDILLLTRTSKERNTFGAIVDYTHRDAYYAAEWEYRYFRLRIEKASGSYIEIGECCIWANDYTLDKNYIWGYSGGNLREFYSAAGHLGQRARRRKFSAKTFQWEFLAMSDTQKGNIDTEIAENENIAIIDGISGEMYYGFLEVGLPAHYFTSNWNQVATFTEIK